MGNMSMNVGRIIAKIPLKGLARSPDAYISFSKEVTKFFFLKGRQITILPFFSETAFGITLRIVFEIPDGPPRFVTLKFGHFLAERLSALKITRVDLYPWVKAKDITGFINLVLDPSTKNRIKNPSGIKIYYGKQKFEAKPIIEDRPIQPPPQFSEIKKAPSISKEEAPPKLPRHLKYNRFCGKPLSEVFMACRRLLEEQTPNPREFIHLKEWLEFALKGHNWERILRYHPDEKANFVLLLRKLKA